MHYGSISRRFVAMLIDWLILTIPVAIGAHALPFVGGVLVLVFYYPFFEASRLQATIGKYLMGIQVTDLNGARLGFRAACLRLLMKALSTCFLCLGHALAIFSERRQAFHDIVAGSVVLYGRHEMSLADAWVDEVRDVFKGFDAGARG